jgi:hypothetical protein
MDVLTVDWLRPIARAAPEKEPCRAARTKASTCSRVSLTAALYVLRPHSAARNRGGERHDDVSE